MISTVQYLEKKYPRVYEEVRLLMAQDILIAFACGVSVGFVLTCISIIIFT